LKKCLVLEKGNLTRSVRQGSGKNGILTNYPFLRHPRGQKGGWGPEAAGLAEGEHLLIFGRRPKWETPSFNTTAFSNDPAGL
jgi:hypothetical protein